jgi:ribosomal protein L37E
VNRKRRTAMSTSVIKRLFRFGRRERCPECGESVRERYCDSCGYDAIRKTRDDALLWRRG